MWQEFIKSFLLIFAAEMGDKTQILAMAFAIRFPVRKVLAGIAIGAGLNHGIAVMLGRSLQTVMRPDLLQQIAGFAFLGFALWTLAAREDEEETSGNAAAYGAVATVALAFFIGELGDKTQLSAITLGAASVWPLVVLAGTTSGMLVTGALGIALGRALGERIPDLAIRLLSAGVFLGFGLFKLAGALPPTVLASPATPVFLLVLLLTVGSLVRWQMVHRKRGALNEAAERLKRYRDAMHRDLQCLCGQDCCPPDGECPLQTIGSLVDGVQVDQAPSCEPICPVDHDTLQRCIERTRDEKDRVQHDRATHACLEAIVRELERLQKQ